MEHQINDTSHKIPFPMYLTGTNTPATGITVTLVKRKAGGSFTAIGGSVSEIANGFYEFTPIAGDVDTLGFELFYATGAGCDPTIFAVDIVSYDPFAITDFQTGLVTTGYLDTALSSVEVDLTPVLNKLDLIKAKTDLIVVGGFTILSPLDPDTQTLTLTYGNDYTATSGQSIPDFENADWSVFDLSSAENVKFETHTDNNSYSLSKDLTVISDTSLRLELTADELTHFSPTLSIAQIKTFKSRHTFSIKAVLATGEHVTLAQGQIFIIEDVT